MCSLNSYFVTIIVPGPQNTRNIANNMHNKNLNVDMLIKDGPQKNTQPKLPKYFIILLSKSNHIITISCICIIPYSWDDDIYKSK